MAVPKVTLYYDIVSPFAYMAFHILRKSPTFAKCDVKFVPIFLGGLMNTCGNTPPIRIKNKDRWIDQERLRWARYFSIPICDKMPDGFPPLTLAVQRVLVAISQKYPNQLIPATEAIWRSFWVEGDSKATTPAGFVPILEKVLGSQETKAVLEAANAPEIKALLTTNTQTAFDSGAFGLPWFECTNAKGEKEGFWGIDHLGQVADFLELDRSKEGGLRACL